MIIFFKTLKLTCILSVLIFSNSLFAEICKSYSEKVSGISGTMDLSGDICLTENTYSGALNGSMNVTYKNYNANGAFSRDGLVVLSYTGNSLDPVPTSISQTYHGGPVSYVIADQTYLVEFNNLTYVFDGSMLQTGESGSISLNGLVLEAKDVPYDYVKIF